MRRGFFLGPAEKGETPIIAAYTPDEVARARREMAAKGFELIIDCYEYKLCYKS